MVVLCNFMFRRIMNLECVNRQLCVWIWTLSSHIRLFLHSTPHLNLQPIYLLNETFD